jgi:hypothetical protein
MSGAILALTLMPSWYAKGKNYFKLLLFPRLCICLVDSILLVLFNTLYCVYLHGVSSKENGLLFLYRESFCRLPSHSVGQSPCSSHKNKPISSSYF